MTKISYQSKDGRLAGEATFYEYEVGKAILHSWPLNYQGEPYQWNTIGQEDKAIADKKAAQFNKLLNSKKLNLIHDQARAD